VGNTARLLDNGDVEVIIRHSKTSKTAGGREWTVEARTCRRPPERGRRGSRLQNRALLTQAATAAGRAWGLLIKQAAPLLRGGSGTSALFLSAQGALLEGGSSFSTIASRQLAAAGLPGQTARSVRGPGFPQREGKHSPQPVL